MAEKEKATQKQLDFLKSLGYKGKDPYSKEDASKEISKLVTIKNANALRDKVNYDLTEDVIAVTDKNIGLYSYVLTKCVEADIFEPPLIGMLFNNISLDLRKKQINSTQI